MEMTSKEALKVLYNYNTDKGYDARYFKIVEKDLDRLEKLEKVIEILKKKWVLIFRLFRTTDVEDYNTCIADEYKLTEEEYKLLKEVLDNDK